MTTTSSRDAVGWFWAASRLIGPLMLLASCENQQGPILRGDEFLINADGQERRVGGGCIYSGEGNKLVDGGTPGRPQGEAGAFESRYEGTDDGVRFSFVTNAGEVLAQRHYDAAFINSERVDEVLVEFAGNTWRYLNRGVPECPPSAQM